MARTTNINDLMKKKGRKKKGSGSGFDILGQGQVLVDAARKRKGATDASDAESDSVNVASIATPDEVIKPEPEVSEKLSPLETKSPDPQRFDRKKIVGAVTKDKQVRKKTELLEKSPKQLKTPILVKSGSISNSMDLYREILKKISAERAYLFLMLRCLGTGGQLSLSVPNIAAELSIQDRSAQRLIKDLVESGLLILVSEYDRKTKAPRVYKFGL